MEKEIYNKIISWFISKFCPMGEGERLTYAGLFLKLAETHPFLAADALLKKNLVGKLEETIGEIAQQISFSGNNCRALFELAFNLYGLESKKIGLSQLERDISLRWIIDILKKWERIESGKQVIGRIINNFLEETKNAGGMSFEIARNIEEKMAANSSVELFLKEVGFEIEQNIYFKMADGGMSKFGNDSAIGLRFLRHLGFFQSTTNPLIISKAYNGSSRLWEDFLEMAEINPEWKSPEKYGDELAIFATINAVLPNVLILRPIALLSDFEDGLATYQLNPSLDEDIKKSLEDVAFINSVIKEILSFFDVWLGWGDQGLGGRPNLLFKVPSSSQKDLDITKRINENGMPTINTVTFGVSQEIFFLLGEAEGMIAAKKKGLPLARSYQATLLGRVEDYLREVETKEIIKELSKDDFGIFVKDLFGIVDVKGGRTEITNKILKEKILGSLDDGRIVRFFSDETAKIISKKEEDIKQSGILVACRVYDVFLGERLKISQFLEKRFGMDFDEISAILKKIDLLPASKRRAEDTLCLLGVPGVTNAETHDQQLRIFLKSKEPGFSLDEYKNSIKRIPDPELIKRLSENKEFREVFELSKETKKILEEMGIEKNFGDDGRELNDWKKYGGVEKIMGDFRESYNKLKEAVTERLKTAN